MWRRITVSLSRKLRLAAEKKLKEGQVRVLVATASLELGIDVGTVDLAVQINSPRAIAVALQRVGRSGHWRGAVPKGRFFATTRDDLMECAALVRAIKQGDLDRLMIPEAPLDVLAQQIVATCAAGQELDVFFWGAGSEAMMASRQPARTPALLRTPGATAESGPPGDGWDEDELFALRAAGLSVSRTEARNVRLDSRNAVRGDCGASAGATGRTCIATG